MATTEEIMAVRSYHPIAPSLQVDAPCGDCSGEGSIEQSVVSGAAPWQPGVRVACGCNDGQLAEVECACCGAWLAVGLDLIAVVVVRDGALPDRPAREDRYFDCAVCFDEEFGEKDAE